MYLEKSSKVKKKSQGSSKKTNIVLNKNVQENPNFNYKDLDTLENHWVKIKGEVQNGVKQGICLIYLFNGDRIYCKFENDIANGKGLYKKKNGQNISGRWKKNKFSRMRRSQTRTFSTISQSSTSISVQKPKNSDSKFKFNDKGRRSMFLPNHKEEVVSSLFSTQDIDQEFESIHSSNQYSEQKNTSDLQLMNKLTDHQRFQNEKIAQESTIILKNINQKQIEEEMTVEKVNDEDIQISCNESDQNQEESTSSLNFDKSSYENFLFFGMLLA